MLQVLVKSLTLLLGIRLHGLDDESWSEQRLCEQRCFIAPLYVMILLLVKCYVRLHLRLGSVQGGDLSSCLLFLMSPRVTSAFRSGAPRRHRYNFLFLVHVVDEA